MCLGLQMAALGGVFLFHTWTWVFLLITFMFLFICALREEQALAMEYPDHWESHSVNALIWFPECRRR
jgi:protein-S-isoprenylcysteine O-methyltransferase Ste14